LDDYGRLFGFSRRIHFSLGFQFIGWLWPFIRFQQKDTFFSWIPIYWMIMAVYSVSAEWENFFGILWAYPVRGYWVEDFFRDSLIIHLCISRVSQAYLLFMLNGVLIYFFY
jgi:hypothetical protein